MKNELLILIPTYNEIENVEEILSQILGLELPADILFIDDNSPDGTGDKLEQLAEKYSNISVSHRKGKLGIGSAHEDGINFAYNHSYRLLLTMDCDFSHSPSEIKDFIKLAEQADIVIGSRFINKGSLKEWNFLRWSLTHIGHIATRLLLNMPYDASGAFRLYRLDKISRYFLDNIHSRGYSFFYESLYVLHLNEYRIVEIPIILPARVYGHSKMRVKDAIQSLLQLLKIYFITKLNYGNFVITEPIISGDKIVDTQGWDGYWGDNRNNLTLYIYGLVAAFYRKFIIKPSLNHFIFKYFNRQSKLLHAGCGGGQVDIDISENINITALDISTIALNQYKKNNQNVEKLIHGSIFSVPVHDSSFDGIYNLGVMEHFTEDEIMGILKEFHRVLKSNGKIILFWPPEYGLSVQFLKFAHFILNKIFRKKYTLHPDEISRIKSYKYIQNICNRANFNIDKYSFGIRDFFTYCVVVLSKDTKR